MSRISVQITNNTNLTLSLRTGGNNPRPFRIFPRAVFAFFLRFSYGPFTHPLSRYPCMQKKFKNFAMKKVGVCVWGGGGGGEGGGGYNNPPS